MHNRQHGGDGIFRKQLLAGENDNNKAEGVSQILQQITAGQGAKVNMKNPLATSEALIDKPAAIADHSSAMASRSSSFSPSANHLMGGHCLRRQTLLIHFYFLAMLLLFAFNFSFIAIMHTGGGILSGHGSPFVFVTKRREISAAAQDML